MEYLVGRDKAKELAAKRLETSTNNKCASAIKKYTARCAQIDAQKNRGIIIFAIDKSKSAVIDAFSQDQVDNLAVQGIDEDIKCAMKSAK